MLGAIAAGNDSLISTALGTAWLVTHARRVRTEWTSEACGAARVLAEQLGLGPAVVRALDETFEHYDGSGAPRGIGGADLSAAARVVLSAHVAIVFWLEGGVAVAREVLAARAGKALDPGLAARAAALLPSFGAPEVATFEARVAELERVLTEVPITTTIEAVAVCFGDFADLQSPFTRGHSRNVAATAVRAAQSLGLGEHERAELRLAAHLHDLGHVAVPAALWLRPRTWDSAERERAHSHTFWTEHILAGAQALAGVARIAGAHHERLDGSGYHRSLHGATLSRGARLLAAADVATALAEARPHRPVPSREAARALLLGAVRDGALDRECVEAVLAARGEAPSRAVAGPVAGLTEREQDVLRLLAQGRTNKQIGAALGISDRTVQHHSIHIYRKLGVDTRAAAALLAARHGLV
jgi:HD-GYP domain-containing protein (c-di-GMP phosphodiesterase class II)